MTQKKVLRLLLLTQFAILGITALVLLDHARPYWQRHLIADSTSKVEPSVPKQPKETKKTRSGQPEPYNGDLRSLAQINVRDAKLKQVFSGLTYPWAMEFLSGEELLVTEIGGQMKLVNITSSTATAIKDIPKIPTGKPQLGLLDVALDPEYASNNRIFFSHAVSGEGKDKGKFALAVSRAVLNQNQLTQVEQIFVSSPFGKSTSNFGGALEFDNNGRLYIATGDRSVRNHARDFQSLNGKILRINVDGSPASGNPHVSNPDIDNRLYAIGVRNPQGLVFDSLTQRLFETEHGPMGGDEVNIIQSRTDMGWPKITYGANYTTQRIGVGPRFEGLQQPLFYYLPSLAISPIAIYRGNMFPEWDGHLLVGALKGNLISKLDLLDGRILSEHRILNELRGRIRDIKIASDGSLYILVQNGKIYRLFREQISPKTKGTEERNGISIYNLVCASCHSSQIPGAPQLLDNKEWKKRLLVKGRSKLIKNTISGMNGMPERGLCERCTDTELVSAVDYILTKSGADKGK